MTVRNRASRSGTAGIAVADARSLSDGGVDGIILGNASDTPFSRPEHIGPETVAALAVPGSARRISARHVPASLVA